MPFYYASASQQNTNATANTDTFLMNLKTTAAGQRAWLQKLQAAIYATPADNQVRLRIQRTTTLLTAGGAFTPMPMSSNDVPAAASTVTTLPTVGALSANPPVQVAFNQRGTGLWAAFTPDEAVGIDGATAPDAELVLNSQATGTSLACAFKLIHSE